MARKPDFSGWATRFNIRCSDGRTIKPEAFKACDGMTVPMVWGHQHDDPGKVLGHALLMYKPEGIYMNGYFNGSKSGQDAKEAVRNRDVTHLSIYANNLEHAEGTRDVIHGLIREVSLVLAGANPGAVIDNPVLAHSGDLCEEEAHIYMYDSEILMHADDEEETPASAQKKPDNNGDEKTVKDVFDSMSEEQKNVCYFLIGKAVEDAKAEHSDIDDGGYDMKHNVFDSEDFSNESTGYLSHDEMTAIFKDGKRLGSLKDSFLQHAEDSENPADYGIRDIEWLFPDFKNDTNIPAWIKRPDDWVTVVMNGVHRLPFSRVRSRFADITEDEARAKGYIKGKFKKEEVISLLKRTTNPTTIYKKQKLDRDDIIDITDFDVVAWLKTEMRMMLNEEIARAVLLGDGRLASDDDKIPEDHIRPIVNDANLFVIRYAVSGENDDLIAKNIIRGAVKSRKNYRGSGRPTLFTSEEWLTNMLLLEDATGRRLYKTEAELATAMRVEKFVTVPMLEGYTDKDNKTVYGIIVNLADYSIGADKGGSINMFEDFDIDYNAEKYLIETRCSGAMTVPFSAIVLRSGEATMSEEPTMAEIREELR